MFNNIILFIIAVGFGAFGGIMGWSYGKVISIIIAITIINIGLYLYVILQSQNLNLINYILKRNKKEPSYAYILALKNEDITEMKNQLEKAINKYKNTTHVFSYTFILAILNENFEDARKQALATKNKGFREYHLALLDAYEGKGDQHFKSQFSKPWMNAAIKTTHYFIIGEIELYHQFKLETLKYSKGIQHAANFYSYQFNEHKELNKKQLITT